MVVQIPSFSKKHLLFMTILWHPLFLAFEIQHDQQNLHPQRIYILEEKVDDTQTRKQMAKSNDDTNQGKMVRSDEGSSGWSVGKSL